MQQNIAMRGVHWICFLFFFFYNIIFQIIDKEIYAVDSRVCIFAFGTESIVNKSKKKIDFFSIIVFYWAQISTKKKKNMTK